MGLASGVILDSQIDASDHVGELILEKVRVCSWISPAIPHSFGISWYILQDHFSSESAVRLKSSSMLQEETVSCIRWLAPLHFDSVTSLLSVSQARESGSSLWPAGWPGTYPTLPFFLWVPCLKMKTQVFKNLLRFACDMRCGRTKYICYERFGNLASRAMTESLIYQVYSRYKSGIIW